MNKIERNVRQTFRLCFKIFIPIGNHICCSNLLLFLASVYFRDNDTLIWNIILLLHLVTYDLWYKADIMSTQKYIWLYFHSKNNKITCSICDESFLLSFSKSAHFHVIKQHKKYYEKTIKKGDWLGKFYKISDRITCKLCEHYEPLNEESNKLLRHLIKKHKINDSKVDYLYTWIKDNFHVYFKQLHEGRKKKRCKECKLIYKESNFFKLMKHLFDDHHSNININISLEMMPTQ